MSLGEPLRAGELLLRDMVTADVAALLEMRRTPEIVRWWGRGADDWPAEMTDGEQLLAIEVGGQLAGHIELYEETDPDWRWASLDIFVAPHLIGHGHGTAALRLIVEHLIETRGHHRITIDPAVDNAPAIRSYEKVGFVTVGRMRRYWRDQQGQWRDSLLMELVVEPR